MKISVIGAGNMGGAIVRGLCRGTLVGAADICVSNPSAAKLEALAAACPGLKTTHSNVDAVAGADLVVLAVKPWKIQGVIDEIKPYLDYCSQAVASVAGGLGLESLAKMLVKGEGELPAIFYVIPNTAAAVGESMTFLSSAQSTPELDAEVTSVFAELGEAKLVEERLMNPGMVLASCGIAFAMRYVRAAMEGGVELGFYAKDAKEIVMQTMKGAVAVLEASGEHPEAEIDKVTTPGGLTIRGLNAMEDEGFTSSVIAGLRASLPKSK